MAESTGSRLKRDDDFWDTKPTDCQTSDNNFGGVSAWCGQVSFRKFTHNVREGDRLELVNSNLPHLRSWAICKSFSKWGPLHLSAVHFFSPANEEWKAYPRNTFLDVSFPASKYVIAFISISMLLNKQSIQVRINNSKDIDWPPLGTGHICKAFTDQLKELQEIAAGVEVYVCRNQFKDSEHFVNYCRYGRDHQHNNYGKVSEWYSEANIEGFIREVCVGDKLKFRNSSPHERWGIYIGQWWDDSEQVVLFAKGYKTKSAMCKERLKPKLWLKSIRIHVVDGCNEVRINNEDDRMWLPLDREDILKEITHQLLGTAHTHYECKVLFKDSEGFVNYCRYDDWRINHGLVSDWCESGQSLPRLHVGDRLEFYRTARPYTHWGIYAGEWEFRHDQVVHFAPADGNGKIFFKKKSSGSGSSTEEKPVLCVDDIWTFPGKVRINNERDKIWPPFDRTDILDEIERQLKSQLYGNKPVYHLFSNNCEHFVNHCRYGRHHSDQVSPFSKILDRVTKGQ